jgi:hypothetical protein
VNEKSPPTLYVDCPDDHGDGYEVAREEHILAQPCVVAALAAARAAGTAETRDAMYDNVGRQERIDAEVAKHPELHGQRVSVVTQLGFTGKYEDVARQVAQSLPPGTHGFRVLIDIGRGDYFKAAT